MDIIDKARELGLMIAGSEEMTKLKNSETALENDGHARELMEDYKKLQIALVKVSREKRPAGELEEARERLIKKQLELNEYKTTNDYLEAKTSFDRLMENINNVITFAITGEECSPSKCSSCKGCG